MQWIPSHVGIAGAALRQPTNPISLKSSKGHICQILQKSEKDRRQVESAGKIWASLLNKPIPHHLPRQESVATFRTITGHDYLPAHLHRIGVLPDPSCPICDFAVMNADHLWTCSGLDDTRTEGSNITHLYWSARHRMAEMPRVGVG